MADGLLYLRQNVTECNNQHIAEILARRASDDADNEALKLQSGEQRRLNWLVAELGFGSAD